MRPVLHCRMRNFILLISFAIVSYFLFQLYQLSQLNKLQQQQSPIIMAIKTTDEQQSGNHHQSHSNIVNIKENAAEIGNLHNLEGVPPDELETYRMAYGVQASHFECIHTKELISSDWVNDDYCDCADGTDEILTSACSHLPQKRFYCKSSCKDVEDSIPASWVNDGICDCCDGSDEMEKHIMDRSKNQFAFFIFNLLGSNSNKRGNRAQSCFEHKQIRPAANIRRFHNIQFVPKNRKLM